MTGYQIIIICFICAYIIIQFEKSLQNGDWLFFENKILEKITYYSNKVLLYSKSSNMQQGKFSLLMQSWFGASWRTTLLGCAGAIFWAISPMLKDGGFNLHRDYPVLIKAAGLAVFSFFCKDANVTGGNVDNGKTPTP